MKHFFVLMIVAIITILILLFLTNPELLENIWLWIIGFIGYILTGFKNLGNSISNMFKKETNAGADKSLKNLEKKEQPNSELVSQLQNKINLLEKNLNAAKGSELKFLSKATITVLRYLDDGQTSLGLLFLGNKFFAYTLEDTYHLEKEKGNTRIPAGLYQIGFKENITPLTKIYRNKFSWFDKHLEIKDIRNFSDVYIHIGNSHKDTAGCLLIADGVSIASPIKSIINSKLAFERFYKAISSRLNTGEEIYINLFDEGWFSKSQIETQ